MLGDCIWGGGCCWFRGEFDASKCGELDGEISDWFRRLWCGRLDELLDDDDGGISWLANSWGDMVPDAAAAAAATAYWSFSAGGRRLTS